MSPWVILELICVTGLIREIIGTIFGKSSFLFLPFLDLHHDDGWVTLDLSPGVD